MRLFLCWDIPTKLLAFVQNGSTSSGVDGMGPGPCNRCRPDSASHGGSTRGCVRVGGGLLAAGQLVCTTRIAQSQQSLQQAV